MTVHLAGWPFCLYIQLGSRVGCKSFTTHPGQLGAPYYWSFTKLGACHCVEARIRSQLGGAYAIEHLYDVLDWSTSKRTVVVDVQSTPVVTNIYIYI
jgi:hypothetical protein